MKRTATVPEEPQLKLLPSGAGEPGATEELKSYALVELFGHQRIVGYLSQQTFGSGVLFRVDVPDLKQDDKVVRPGFTRYFGLSSIYSITPISADMVRELLPGISGHPEEVRPLQFSRRSSEEDY